MHSHLVLYIHVGGGTDKFYITIVISVRTCFLNRNEEGGCGEYWRYEELHGTTEKEEYNAGNGMGADPFYIAKHVD